MLDHCCSQYVDDVKSALERLPWSSIEALIALLHDARLNDRQVFIFGNGGSAATASHMACDLGKNTAMSGWPRFRVMALVDNMPAVSAIANDLGYENVFAEQLIGFVRRQDVVIAISTSGNSPNVVRAVECAIAAGATTVGMTGAPGGQVARLVHLPVVIASHHADQVEDVHLIIEHMLVRALRAGLNRPPVREAALMPIPARSYTEERRNGAGAHSSAGADIPSDVGRGNGNGQHGSE